MAFDRAKPHTSANRTQAIARDPHRASGRLSGRSFGPGAVSAPGAETVSQMLSPPGQVAVAGCFLSGCFLQGRSVPGDSLVVRTGASGAVPVRLAIGALPAGATASEPLDMGRLSFPVTCPATCPAVVCGGGVSCACCLRDRKIVPVISDPSRTDAGGGTSRERAGGTIIRAVFLLVTIFLLFLCGGLFFLLQIYEQNSYIQIKIGIKNR